MKIKTTNNTQKAQEYFGQFSQENLLKLKTLADILKNEIEITKKITNDEREQLYYVDTDLGVVIKNYENSEYVLKPNFERAPTNLNSDELEKILQKVGNAFRFFDPTTPPHNPVRDDNYIGITSKENFDFFYNQLKEYIASTSRVLYRIEYNPLVRDILIHTPFGAYFLKKPDFESENDRFMAFIIENTGRKITLQELEKEMKVKIKKTLHQILNDLGFTSALRELFFPNVSKNSIEFYNNITEEHLLKLYRTESAYKNKIEALNNQIKLLERPL